MSVVTEKNPKRTKKTRAAIVDPQVHRGERLMVAVRQLERHPDNRQPTEAAIAAVAASLASEGQIEPLKVRVIRGADEFQNFPTYQIISGETRWRAARQLGWDSIECEVLALDDAATLRILAAANAARQDLDPIATARLIVRLCEPTETGGSGLTREEAARMFDLQSGGAASNLVRLLELPEVWQRQVASGELPQSYARELLPLLQLGADSPAWGDTFVEWNRRGDQGKFGPFYSRDDVRDFVGDLLSDHSRPIERGDEGTFEVEPRHHQRHPLRFKLTPSLEEELRIIEVEIDGKKVRRATNCQLYDSFQIPAIKAHLAKKNKGKASADEDDERPAAAAQLTPKQQAAADAERREKAAEQLAKRVERWRAAWLRELVAVQVEDKGGSCKWDWVAHGLAMWLVSRVPNISYRDRAALGLDEFLPWRGVLQRDKMPTPNELACKVLRYQPEHDGEHPVPDDKVEDLVELLKIDLADQWGVMQAGRDKPERFQEFFELHNAEQLDELGTELGVGTTGAAKKSGKVAAFLAAQKTLKLPRCLRPLRKVKS